MASSLYNKLYKINQIKTQKITASNLKTGVNAFGINGTFTSNTNALFSDIADGKTAYVNGSKVTGTLRQYNNLTDEIPFYTHSVNNISSVITSHYYNNINIVVNSSNVRVGDGVIRNQAYMNIGFNTISRLLNIQPVDIKKGAKILDIEGQYDASTEFSGIKMDPVVESDTSVGLTTSIREISGLDMANGTNLSYYFSNLYGLTLVSNINTPKVTNLFRLFYQSYNLKTFTAVNLYGEEQTGVSCYEMFNYCRNLEGFNNVVFPKVISSCNSMFNQCSNITDITSTLNISGLTAVPPMFNYCTNLVNVTNIMFNNTANLNLYYLFVGCYNLNVLGVPFDNIRVSVSTSMFDGVKSINDSSIYTLLNKFNLFVVGSSTFANTSLTKIPNFANTNSDVRISVNTPWLFSRCNNITSIDDTEHLLHQFTNVQGLFQGCSNLQSFNGTVNNNGMMAQMFLSCSNLETVNIGNVYSFSMNLSGMFYNCSNLVSVNFLNDVNYIGNANSMFRFCENLTDLNLNVNSIYNGTFMFQNCKNLKRVNIRNNINGYLYGMFQNCYNLSSIGINTISGSGINSITYLFANCYNLVGDMTLEINNTSFSNDLQYVFYNTGLSNINANIGFNYTGSYYAVNMNYFIAFCNNLKTINVNINDRYGSTNYFNAQYFGYHCPNLENINASFKTNRTSFLQIGQESPNIKNVALDVDTTNGVTMTLYGYNAQAYTVNMINSPVVNCYMYQFVTPPKLNVTNVNRMGRFAVYYVNDVDTVEYNVPSGIQSASNLNLQFVNNVRSISINSMSINNVSNMNDITVSNMNNVSNVSVITNTHNINTISIRGIFNSSSTNINIPYIRSVNVMNVQTVSNIPSLNLDFTGLNTINTFNYYSAFDHTDINININMCNVKNSIPLLHIEQITANTNMFINLASVNSINYLRINYGYNLYEFNYDFSSVKSINKMYILYCNSLSNNTLDNLLGLLGNVTYNSYKNLASVFVPVRTAEFWSNLPNYNNLIAKGWTVN